MKWYHTLALAFLLAVAPLAIAQEHGYTVRTTNYAQLTLTNSAFDTLYFLFPDRAGNFYFSSTKPTAYWSGTSNRRSNTHWVSGDLDMILEVTRTSGKVDSVHKWIKPLIWDEYDKAYEVISSDSTILAFGRVNTYTAATNTTAAGSDTLAVDVPHHCLLTGETWPVSGFILVIRQVATACVNVYTAQPYFGQTWR